MAWQKGDAPGTFVPYSGDDSPFRPRRRRRVTGELLDEVATVYKANMDSGSPTQAVADTLHVSHSTAARYVNRARQAKKLPAVAGSTKKGQR